MTSLLRRYVETAPEIFWKQVRERGSRLWLRVGAPPGRRAVIEARLERRLRARLSAPVRPT